MALLMAAGAAWSAPSTSVQLEDLTWVEVRDRIAAGAKVALVPIGGTEQNGPHMALGKHNVRAKLLAERIAKRHGAALVAPVVAFVPEGAIDPAQAHMRWPGTLTVTEATFEAMLESTARSLLHAGFTDVVLLGDHGGYRRSLDRVAARMPHVHALPEYYRASVADFDRVLRQRGFSDAEIGLHAGLSDTALMMALDPSLVRAEALPLRAPGTRGDGVEGDPRRASGDLAREAVEHVVDVTVLVIRQRTVAKTQSVTKP